MEYMPDKNLNAILVAVCMLLFSGCLAQDYHEWPDWRGKGRNGIWLEQNIISEFPGPEIGLKWRTPLGSGYSSPTVSQGKVYVMDRITSPEEQERVRCFDGETGRALWTYAYECRYQGIGYQAGPRASVVLDEGRAYALGAMGHLHCLDAANGNPIWEKDMDREYGIRMPIWGIAAAPLVVDDKLILHIGGSDHACVLALDKKNGQEIWTASDDQASYTAPYLTTQAGRKVVVVWTGDNLNGLSPDTGEIYWKLPFRISMQMGISTPVRYGNYIFVSGFFDGSLLAEISENELTAEVKWRRQGTSERNTDALHCCISTPVILDGYIYGIDSYGEMRCLELETGERVWENNSVVNINRWANVHLIQQGELTWMFNEHGELIISRLSPEGFEELSRARLIEPTTGQLNRGGIGVTWTHPAFAGRHVYVRNDRELVCADLGK
jgi:outer membrane protein assembly factor BamB